MATMIGVIVAGGGPPVIDARELAAIKVTTSGYSSLWQRQLNEQGYGGGGGGVTPLVLHSRSQNLVRGDFANKFHLHHVSNRSLRYTQTN